MVTGWASSDQSPGVTGLLPARLALVTTRLTAVPRPVRTLMDALCAANLWLYLSPSYINDFRIWDPGEIAVLVGARSGWALIIVGLWLAVRRWGTTGWIVAFCLLSLLGTLMDEFSMLVMAIVVVYVYLGRRAGHVFVGASTAGYGMLLLVPGGWTTAKTFEILLRFVLSAATPALLGYVLRRYFEASLQLAATNAELGQAALDLRAQATLDQDLLLAEERTRAARELHDGLGHQLTSAGMSLDFASRTLVTNPEAALTEAEAARRALSEASAEIRSWAQAVHPVGTRALGLAGLPALVQGFRHPGMTINLDLPAVPLTLGRRQELFVTRFAQEGLTNAFKHGRAGHVTLGVRVEEDTLVMQLADDGAGPSQIQEGFGLRSLRERAEELDGAFVASVTDVGFTIQARLPLTSGWAGARVG